MRRIGELGNLREGRAAGSRGVRRGIKAGLIALGILGGCGEIQSPVSPEPAARASAPALQDETAPFSFATDDVLLFLTPPDLTSDRHAGTLIKAKRGGFVELQGFRVDIPAGALSKDTFVTIDLPTTLPEASYIVADFGPSGTRFKKPVQITLPLGDANLVGVDLDTVEVSYWNGSGWESYGGTATPDAVRSTTTHFSTYGARSTRGGIDTSSGG